MKLSELMAEISKELEVISEVKYLESVKVDARKSYKKKKGEREEFKKKREEKIMN